MVTPESIKQGIEAGLACEHVEVAGDGQHFQALIVSTEFAGRSRVQRHQLVYAQHFQALIVSTEFAGRSRVQRHQLVYAALGERMREEIHALSMRTLTPQEWRAGG